MSSARYGRDRGPHAPAPADRDPPPAQEYARLVAATPSAVGVSFGTRHRMHRRSRLDAVARHMLPWGCGGSVHATACGPGGASALSFTPVLAYVSCERYIAQDDVTVLLQHEESGGFVETKSRADGAVVVSGELPSGQYRVTLRKVGYTSKRTSVTLPVAEPCHFRVLSEALVGYMWPKWVQEGEHAEFRVNSSAAYKLELFRYGLEKRKVRTIGWFDEHGPLATQQTTPDGDYTQTGIQFNKEGYSNNPHHRQTVEAPAHDDSSYGGGGLYYVHAENLNGEFFAFPWIVAPAEPTSDVAVLLANMNWNAYNSYGGRSNYIHPKSLPEIPSVSARQDLLRYQDQNAIQFDSESYAPLSFERPEPLNHVPKETQVTDPVDGRSECHVAPAECRLLGWLERQGVPYDTYAETQLHFGTLNLDDYKLLIISAHPEYWSHEMYYALKAWVFERGGRLMYLGGNGLNCEVKFPTPSSMVCFNSPLGGSSSDMAKHARRADGSLSPTPLESRFDYYFESEANLLGVRCTEEGIMTGAPYEVVDPDHWVFDGTGLQAGDRFGEESLHVRCPGGASGHETDKMSPSSPEGTILLAKGTNDGAPTQPGQQTGGAHMVIHETATHGAVFSVGSITYPCSLLVDENISTVTQNVLDRFVAETV